MTHPPRLPYPLWLSSQRPAMARVVALRVILVVAATVAAVVAAADARESDRDRIARERLVWQVVAEHTDALNRCDLRRLMAQHP